MTSTPRFWLLGGVLAAVLLAVLGWNFVVSPRMEAVALTRADTEELNAQTDQTMLQTRQLKAQAKDLPAQIRALERMQRRIPASVNVPELLRQVQRAAAEEGVAIESLTPGQITTFSAADEAKPTSTPTTSDEPQAGADKTAPAPQPTPQKSDLGQGTVPEGVGLSYVPITITARGDFNSIRAFAGQIESLQRAYLITGLELGRDAQSGSKELSVTLDTRVFVASDLLRSLPQEALDAVGGQ